MVRKRQKKKPKPKPPKTANNSSSANFLLFPASMCFTASVCDRVLGLAGCSVPPWDLSSQFFAAFAACQHFHCISIQVTKDANSGPWGWQPLESCEQNQQAESIGWICGHAHALSFLLAFQHMATAYSTAAAAVWVMICYSKFPFPLPSMPTTPLKHVVSRCGSLLPCSELDCTLQLLHPVDFLVLFTVCSRICRVINTSPGTEAVPSALT